MKKYVVILVFTSIFLVSCGEKEKEEVSQSWQELNLSLVWNQQVDSEKSSIKDDEKMMDKKDKWEWTKEEMKMMDGEHGDDMMKDDEKMMDDDKEVVMKTGTYTAYDKALIGKTDNTVIFFAATWCPSCRALDAGITSGEVPEGLTILKADYDSEKDLKKKYGVVSQHTLVQVDADGALIKKWSGWSTVESIVEKLK